MIKDIWPGASGSFPRSLSVVDNNLYFVADDGTRGSQLWVSDGTNVGTAMVQDLMSGGSAEWSVPNDLTSVGNKLYFRSPSDTRRYDLWALTRAS